MANISMFDVSGGVVSVLSQRDIIAAAAVQTVPPVKDERMALRISNDNATTTVTAVVKAGDGPRAVLGDKTVDIAAGDTAYVALFDTARFMTFADGTVSVELLASGGVALTAEELVGISIEGIQL